MRRPEIIMVGKEDCPHCRDAKSVITEFYEKNKSLIDMKVIPFDEYEKNEVYGSYGNNYPLFFYKSKSGVVRNFDFMNADNSKRTYDVLRKKIIEFSKML